MPETAQKDVSEKSLNNQEERFCYVLVNTGDKYEAFRKAKYKASTKEAEQACVSRLLRRPWIKARIKVLEREYYEALGIDEKRILGNVAEIAFDKKAIKSERLKALELLGKERAMWKEKTITEEVTNPITDAERALYERMAREMNIKISREGTKTA